MSGEIAAVLLLFVVHVIGFAALFALCGRSMLEVFRTDSHRDDGWGEPPAGDPVTTPPPSGGGLPLPDAEQAPVRLREPGRIGKRYDRPARRPEHEPARTPQRV
jgi:hypothetical protein